MSPRHVAGCGTPACRTCPSTYVSDWHRSRGFVEANADHVLAAARALPAGIADGVELVFTAHSIPASMAERYPYQAQLEESCAAVAAEVIQRGGPLAPRRWRLVFQSRSGRPEDPWLGPDVCDYLREAAGRQVKGVVLSPIGFVCDHVEVLYDLDIEAATVAREVGLPLARAAAVNDHPRFIDTLADAVAGTVERYAGGRPLPLVNVSAPSRV